MSIPFEARPFDLFEFRRLLVFPAYSSGKRTNVVCYSENGNIFNICVSSKILNSIYLKLTLRDRFPLASLVGSAASVDSILRLHQFSNRSIRTIGIRLEMKTN